MAGCCEHLKQYRVRRDDETSVDHNYIFIDCGANAIAELDSDVN